MMRNFDRGELQDRLPAYVRGTLPADERAALEAALAADGDLAAELAVVRMAHAALQGRAAPDAVERIVGTLPRPTARGLVGVARWRVAAAIATLAVGGASLAVVNQAFRGDLNEPFGSPTESTQVAGAPPLSITFGYGVSDLPDEALDALIAELEQFDGLPSAEPQLRRIVPAADEGEE